MLPVLLLLIGPSASGKTVFKRTRLEPDGLFYSLRSATTRPMRPDDNESEGNPYFFRDESYFEQKDKDGKISPKEPLATFLWVNEAVWEPGDPKWFYGVPEREIKDNLGRNMVYDVIEPRYAADMAKWFREHKETADYNIKVAWFIPPENDGGVVKKRANMKNDKKVRDTNTCGALDILRAKLTVDYMLCPREGIPSASLDRFLLQLYNNMINNRERQEKEFINRKR
ncbi:MAG: hypothetical protein IKS08_00885 [Alphaproteobacteria bacterium]|nr:hypothetical protein [Alphaproteobacteria bacterium]